FFFQAEDGIRDLIVTGVQTCALPIWPLAWPPIAGLQLIWAIVSTLPVSSRVEAPILDAASAASTPAWPAPQTITSNWKSLSAKRSEERRVGLECRNRWRRHMYM